MAAAIGWLNHAGAAANSVNSVRPMDSSSGSASTSNPDSAGISANDFLTLLVTELKNQDPTANNDPKEYINQLVGVNSLQQLIKINESLSANLGSSTNPSGSTTTSSQAIHTSGYQLTASGANTAAAVHDSGIKTVSGNLNVPETKPAANRVAQALSGQR
jgi:flagellar basal-body rod modification protein FlgD